MELKPHPAMPSRFGLFKLRLDDMPEHMSILSSIDSAHGPLLRDRWLFARLGALPTNRYPATVNVWRGQLGRIVDGLDDLARIAPQANAIEAGLAYTALANILRPYVTKNDASPYS